MIFENPFKYRRKWERRGRNYRMYRNIAITACLLLVTAVGYEYFIVPPPASPDMTKLEALSKGMYSTVQKNGGGNTSSFTKGEIAHPRNPSQETIDQRIHDLKPIPPLSDKPFLHTAFVTQSEPESTRSIISHARQLDAVFPDWLNLTGSGCGVHESIDWNMFETLNQNNILVLPRFSDANTSEGATNFSSILGDKKQSECLIDTLKWNIRNRSVRGINIDMANLKAVDRDAYTDWLLSLTESFHQNNLSVVVSVPMDSEAFDYENIGHVVDDVIVRAYDEHSLGGQPGPVAGKYWFNTSLDTLLQKLPSSKTIVAVGLHGYDWNITTWTTPERRNFERTLQLAENTKATVRWDKESWNNSFSYKANDGSDHEVWFLDAVSVWNEYLSVQQKKFYGVSLAYLGGEDASVWKFASTAFLGAVPVWNQLVSAAQKTIINPPLWWTGNTDTGTNPIRTFDPKTLADIPYDGNIVTSGTGKMYKILSLATEWKRELSFSGKVVTESKYTRFPTNMTLSRFGIGKPKTIALTFYGGPGTQYSEHILNILRAYRIQATFFPTAGQMEQHPDIIKRAYDDGHIFGNQADWQEDTTEQSKRELSGVEQSIKLTSDHRTVLAYAPHDIGTPLPFTANEAWSLYAAANNGYVFMTPDIDSRDFPNPSADIVVENILSRAKNTDSNTIIVLQDDPKQGAQTAQVVEKLIPALQMAGYRFVAANEMLDVSRDALMPEISFPERVSMTWNIFVSGLKIWMWNFLVVLFIITTVVSVLRIVFLGIFVARANKSQKKHFSPKFLKMPPVTILVPAYNEEKVIERTILWLLSSDYLDFEILVVDDGSTDATAEQVRKVMETQPNVRLISKKNEGKSLALNVGFREAKYDYIVTVDADTIVLPKTIYYLIEPFSDRRVDAVCGNIWVGNVKNILTAFQEVEYVTGQNYDRRAFDALNCISVVPGATGAWKKQKVLDIGGYSGDTLVEDADLTLTLLEHGGRIVYAPLARSVTEAPEMVGPLFKQRFRWSYGTFQCFWKHRHTFGKGTLGVIALPNMLLFQVIFPALSPIGDFVLLGAIFFGNLQPILAGYILFFFMDATISGIAYTLDKKSFANIWVILIQRFFYRQFMYFVTFKSIFAAISGSHHGWNKLERKGTVVVEEVV